MRDADIFFRCGRGRAPPLRFQDTPSFIAATMSVLVFAILAAIGDLSARCLQRLLPALSRQIFASRPHSLKVYLLRLYRAFSLAAFCFCNTL